MRTGMAVGIQAAVGTEQPEMAEGSGWSESGWSGVFKGVSRCFLGMERLGCDWRKKGRKMGEGEDGGGDNLERIAG